MAQNKLVVRYLNGAVAKGSTADFLPAKEIFHLMPFGAPPAGQLGIPVYIKECKALFFVKNLRGNSRYQDSREFGPEQPANGRKIQVRFKDNEVLVGTTNGYDPSRPGFFVFPADHRSNIDRCYVPACAVEEASFL